MDEEIPKQIGKRYEVKSYVENTRPLIGKEQRESNTWIRGNKFSS